MQRRRHARYRDQRRSDFLHSHLSPLAFVERLIEANAPIWNRWDGEIPTLLQGLTAAAYHESSGEHSPGVNRHTLNFRRRRLLWLLDRLAPESDGSVFEPFLDHHLGIYAWGRRLPRERRNELTRMPLPARDSPWSRRRFFLQALLLAWCDACPDEELNSLLEWPDHWRPALEWPDVCWLAEPEEEFYRRCTDIGARRQQMVASLSRNIALLDDPDRTTKELAHRIAFRLWTQLLRDVAIQSPSAEQAPPTPEEWIAWFDRTLSLPPFVELADLGRDLLKAHPRNEYLAQSLWIWRNGEAQWRQLHSYSLFHQETRVFDRLAEIAPTDEVDAWDDLVLDQAVDHGEIRAYCKWLAPKYAELLRIHFDHPDRDWGACAYQNYLTKTQEPILEHLWRRARDLPEWQTELLDRRLFAPHSVRPAVIVEGIQKVERDLRLEDPFNHRNF
jgi:hypothetical protein